MQLAVTPGAKYYKILPWLTALLDAASGIYPNLINFSRELSLIDLLPITQTALYA